MLLTTGTPRRLDPPDETWWMMASASNEGLSEAQSSCLNRINEIITIRETARDDADEVCILLRAIIDSSLAALAIDVIDLDEQESLNLNEVLDAYRQRAAVELPSIISRCRERTLSGVHDVGLKADVLTFLAMLENDARNAMIGVSLAGLAGPAEAVKAFSSRFTQIRADAHLPAKRLDARVSAWRTIAAALRDESKISGNAALELPERLLGETHRKAAKFIRENEACDHKAVAKAIGIVAATFSNDIWPDLKSVGFYGGKGNRGCYPPA